MKIDHTEFLVAIKRTIFPTFIQKFTGYLKKKKKKNLTKFINLGNYLFYFSCKKGISNQQIYFFIFLLSIKYVIPYLNHISPFVYIFFIKSSNLAKINNEMLMFLDCHFIE